MSKLCFCIAFFLYFFLGTQMSSKETDDAVDNPELAFHNSGSEEKSVELTSTAHFCPEDAHGDAAPWEKRYEKLWVEVEKREVKSTFKNVAGELKEKFGVLFNSKLVEDSREEAEPAATSAEEDSSDEEGEVIVRPAARARSTVLLSIPEQRESEQEDSSAESLDGSLCEEKMQDSERPTHDSNIHHDPGLVNTDVLTSASPQLNKGHERNVKSINQDTKAFFGDSGMPMYFDYQDSLLKETKQVVFKDPPGDLNVTDKNHVGLRDEHEEFPLSQLSSQIRRPDVSKDLDEDRKRLTLEVGMPRVLFLDFKKGALHKGLSSL